MKRGKLRTLKGSFTAKNAGIVFKNHLSSTGYSCEKWGVDDFFCNTILDSYCHKAKLKEVATKKTDI